jgi:hypothetical protein
MVAAQARSCRSRAMSASVHVYEWLGRCSSSRGVSGAPALPSNVSQSVLFLLQLTPCGSCWYLSSRVAGVERMGASVVSLETLCHFSVSCQRDPPLPMYWQSNGMSSTRAPLAPGEADESKRKRTSGRRTPSASTDGIVRCHQLAAHWGSLLLRAYPRKKKGKKSTNPRLVWLSLVVVKREFKQGLR